MGYQGLDPSSDSSEIRARQQSCYIKDLPEDERPEFWKGNDNHMQSRMTIKQIVHMVRSYRLAYNFKGRSR